MQSAVVYVTSRCTQWKQQGSILICTSNGKLVASQSGPYAAKPGRLVALSLEVTLRALALTWRMGFDYALVHTEHKLPVSLNLHSRRSNRARQTPLTRLFALTELFPQGAVSIKARNQEPMKLARHYLDYPQDRCSLDLTRHILPAWQKNRAYEAYHRGCTTRAIGEGLGVSTEDAARIAIKRHKAWRGTSEESPPLWDQSDIPALEVPSQFITDVSDALYSVTWYDKTVD